MSQDATVVNISSSEGQPKNSVVNPDEKDLEKEQIGEDNTEKSDLDNLKMTNFKYQDVDEMLKEAFNYKESNNSMICDIIAMYLKGQKILYTEAKTLCEQRLNYLMLPTICITAICTVISVVLKEYPFSSTIVSSLNGLNFFFLTLINYLKLDAKAEAHRVAAYKFDKTQSRLEFSSGKILFITGESKELPKIINETEKDVREIKETNQFILPESIRYNFPNLCNINVFAEVKKIQSYETMLINSLKDVLNKYKNLSIKVDSGFATQEEKIELKLIIDSKTDITNKIIKIKDKYLDIDDQFEDEMEEQRLKLSKRYQLCGCLKT